MSDDTLLDAARDCACAFGVRHTSLAGIARQAGVSRMTLYRRFPDVGSVIAALLSRDFGALLHRVRAQHGTAGTARERLVRGVVATVRTLASDPLMRTTLQHDGEFILPYIVERLGTTQRQAEEFIAEQIMAGVADGSVRNGRGSTQSRTVLLIAQSFVFSARAATADLDHEALLSELEHTLHAMLRPHEPEGTR